MPNFSERFYGGRTRTVGVTVSNRRRPVHDEDDTEPAVIATKKMKREKDKKSLFICGHCRVDTKKSKQEIKKVIVGDLANMLCDSCQMELEDSIRDVARRFLG